MTPMRSQILLLECTKRELESREPRKFKAQWASKAPANRRCASPDASRFRYTPSRSRSMSRRGFLLQGPGDADAISPSPIQRILQ